MPVVTISDFTETSRLVTSMSVSLKSNLKNILMVSNGNDNWYYDFKEISISKHRQVEGNVFNDVLNIFYL